MKILTIDIGTGTQDILLYDSRLNIENGFKLVLPSPTMIVHNRIREATRQKQPVLLTGVMMGGGPSAWALESHLKAGLPVYAIPSAARTLNDELEKVKRMGIQLVSEDEALRLADSTTRIEFRDLDLPAILSVFTQFGVSLSDLAAVAVAVFDHGDAPPGISDRQFRFDYLDSRLRNQASASRNNPLSSLAFLREDTPSIMTRLQAVAASAEKLDCPLVVMDTAPAAVLGATFDPLVGKRKPVIIANVGNFHTLAFRLGERPGGGTGIEGLFEHHTGEIDLPKLESLLHRLADGTLKHQDVFDDMGHGALMYSTDPMVFNSAALDVVVTGPRRSMFYSQESSGSIRPYFASPFGDMMLAGNIGLLAATADVLPDLAEPILASLSGTGGSGFAPWDA